MSDHPEDAEIRLARLRAATEGVRPRPDFAGRVARAIDHEVAEADWLSDLLRPARRLVPLAAIAAAAAVLLAMESAPARREAQAMANATELDTQW
jgi:hypothetical protein